MLRWGMIPEPKLTLEHLEYFPNDGKKRELKGTLAIFQTLTNPLLRTAPMAKGMSQNPQTVKLNL